MQKLTPQGQKIIRELATRYGVSVDGVMALLQALIRGHGAMAQFNHPELGGSGQWMQGGMIMVDDMFNHTLKAKVDGLCSELSQWLTQQPSVSIQTNGQSQYQGSQQPAESSFSGGASSPVSLFVPDPTSQTSHWWPSELGIPNTTGAQNNIRYAYFPANQRLALEINGQITVYDTLDHQINGVGQQQGGASSLTFTSQHGTVPVSKLPVVFTSGTAQDKTIDFNQSSSATADRHQDMDIFAKIEKLAELKQKGILSEEEFTRKKAELLSRL